MKKKLILVILMLFSFVLAGCGSFFGSDEEAIVIKSITRVEAEEENGFYIVVEYANEDKANDRFFVPNGEKGADGETGENGTDGKDGQDGVGIKDITMTVDKNTRETTITIYFTDESKEPVVKVVPAGVFVSGVEHGIDKETGNTLIYVKYSDGTRSEAITVEKGQPGNHLTGMDRVENKDGSVDFTFKFSDSEDVVITIPAPKEGPIGVGIDSIIKVESDTNYVIKIKYTDGTSDTVEFDRPNKWTTGSADPDPDEGIIGDYYFDIFHNNIWVKETKTKWTLVVNLKDDEADTVTVTFNLNDLSDGYSQQASMPQGYGKTITLSKGSYFGMNGVQNLPIPTREGFEFKGWYLTRFPSIVNGAFTDVVPVNESITLFAIWELK